MHACFLGFADMLGEYAMFSFTFGSIFLIVKYKFNVGRLDLNIN
jgi:hypothetical protein